MVLKKHATSGEDSGVFGFQIYSWDDSSKAMLVGCYLYFDFESGEVQLKSNDKGSGSDLLLDSKTFYAVVDKEYYIKVLVDGSSVEATISSNLLDDVVLRGKRSNSFNITNGTKDAKQVFIGSDSADIKLVWDSVCIYADNNGIMKTDVEVANDIVIKAFQGIVPFKHHETKTGSYFASIVIGPEENSGQMLNVLAFQNNRRWFFDYDSTFIWEENEIGEPLYTLDDEEFSSVSLSFSNEGFKNWVEVTDGEVSPKIRVSVGEQESIIEDGIFFVQESVSDLYTKEQAKKVALGRLYETTDGMEKLSVSLKRPLVFIKPRDVVFVSSSSLNQEGDANSYTKMYYVEAVSIDVSEGEVSMTLEMVSKTRERMAQIATLYNEGGVSY